MSIQHLRFDHVTEANLTALIDGEVRESLSLEFKRDLPGKDSESKKEFLKDASALANTIGGDVVYGIDETDGVASNIVGVEAKGLDAELQRLSNLLRDGLDPRLSSFDMRGIVLKSGRSVVHLRIAPSVDAPHMVSLGGQNRFYARNPSGAHPMSTSEVRSTVMRSAGWREEVEQWRRERVGLIQTGQGPIPLVSAIHVVVQVVPLLGLGPDLSSGSVTGELTRVGSSGAGAGGWDSRHTFDGFLVATHLPGAASPNRWYRLWLHEGRVEAVETHTVDGGRSSLPGHRIDHAIHRLVLHTFKPNVDGLPTPPMAILVSLLGVNGVVLTSQFDMPMSSTPLDRDMLLVPPILVTDIPGSDEEWWPVLAPTINRIWQAAGRARSPMLGDDGKPLPRR